MDNNNFSCSLCTVNESFDPSAAVTVPAGTVSTGLSACGYPSEIDRLPRVYVQAQRYTEGFCPDTALAVGTMYPELVSIYK